MNVYLNKRKQSQKNRGEEIGTRKRLMELFPRLSYDSYTNKKLNDIEVEEQQQTPKNNKLKQRFDHRNYNQHNDESMSIGSKETDRLGSKIRNPYQKSFAYQSISNQRRAIKRDTLDRYQAHKKHRSITQPNEEVDTLFTSLEQNLSECDKILNKLSGFNPEVKLIQKQQTKIVPAQWNREIEIPSSLSIRRESRAFLDEVSTPVGRIDEDLNQSSYFTPSIRKQSNQNPYASFKITRQNIITKETKSQESQREAQIERYKSLNNQRQEKSRNQKRQSYNKKLQVKERQKSLQQQKIRKQTPIQQQQRPYSQLLITSDNKSLENNSIIQIRRRRINQILQTNKSRIENPIELSFTRLKQRGENMFNRVLRVKEKSKGGDYVYQSDMVQKYTQRHNQ